MASTASSLPVEDYAGHTVQLPQKSYIEQLYVSSILEAYDLLYWKKRMQGLQFDHESKHGVFVPSDRLALQIHEDGNRLLSPPPIDPATVTKTHSMITVSKQLSAEYRKIYYERTKFFFHVSKHNALRCLPEISPSTSSQNFWHAPPVLFHNLRHCTFYIELDEIVKGKLPRDYDPSGEAGRVPFENITNNVLLQTIENMHQVRCVNIVWNMRLRKRDVRRLAALPHNILEDDDTGNDHPLGNYGKQGQTGVPVFLRRFLDALSEKESLSEFCLSVGDKTAELQIMAYYQKDVENWEYEIYLPERWYHDLVIVLMEF
jgi:hypothetical protein